MNFLEQITEIFEKFQLVIWPCILLIYAFIAKIIKEIKHKNAEINKKTSDKIRIRNIANFNHWEHVQSADTISRIKEQCNFTKDRSMADRVQYFQLENGTIAVSKLCNMFITCLTEDSRYGRLTKEIENLQRIPYSRLSTWIEAVKEQIMDPRENAIAMNCINDEALKELNSLFSQPIRSSISAPVFDHNHVFVGVCCLNYAGFDFNESDLESEMEILDQFKFTIESILVHYQKLRVDKLTELGLTDLL